VLVGVSSIETDCVGVGDDIKFFIGDEKKL
jgi:hypothetical protein